MRNQPGHHTTKKNTRFSRGHVLIRWAAAAVLGLLLASLSLAATAPSASAAPPRSSNCVPDVCLTVDRQPSETITAGDAIDLAWVGTSDSYTATTTAPTSSWPGVKHTQTGDHLDHTPTTAGTWQYCIQGAGDPACVTVTANRPACDPAEGVDNFMALDPVTDGRTVTLTGQGFAQGFPCNTPVTATFHENKSGWTATKTVTTDDQGRFELVTTDQRTLVGSPDLEPGRALIHVSFSPDPEAPRVDAFGIRVKPATGNQPVAHLTVSADHGPAPLTVTVDASASTAPNDHRTPADAIANYRFTWGDGTTTGTQTSDSARHTYTHAGRYHLVLTVTDSSGQADTATRTITVTAASGTTTPPTAPSSSSSGLANTGTDNQQGIVVGLGLLLAGTVALALGRGRQLSRRRG